jgi:hypothetical protein
VKCDYVILIETFTFLFKLSVAKEIGICVGGNGIDTLSLHEGPQQRSITGSLNANKLKT